MDSRRMEAVEMMTDALSRWDEFVGTALLSMRRCQKREIDHLQAVNAFDGFDDIDHTITEFVCNSITEQYGNPATFSSLLELLSHNPRPEDIKALMDS